MRLVCRKCKVEISKEITALKDLALLNNNDGEDYIPNGFFMIETGAQDFNTKGLIIINLTDLINTSYHLIQAD
jgi:hypothetical protein